MSKKASKKVARLKAEQVPAQEVEPVGAVPAPAVQAPHYPARPETDIAKATDSKEMLARLKAKPAQEVDKAEEALVSSALINMGYREAHSNEAARQACAALAPGATLSDAISRALEIVRSIPTARTNGAAPKPFKFAKGTKVRFRTWDRQEGPLDREGTVTGHGPKWITISRVNAEGKVITDYSVVGQCEAVENSKTA